MQYNKDNSSITIEEAIDDTRMVVERIADGENWIFVGDINPRAVDMALCALESLNQIIIRFSKIGGVREDDRIH